ncbi:MAG TPA: DUF2244 domain-containing protein [Rudaea sp.]|nr:DUF2244 domain-containing protein [Rudaea sp.]
MWVMPHRSLSRVGLVAFLVAQGFAAGLMAGLAAWRGNVLAPVFAVLELGVVTWCLRRVWFASGLGQLITLTESQLAISSARSRETVQFHPYWVRVQLRPGRERGWPNRLVLGSHGRELEVGAFLNDEERRELAQRLAELLRPLQERGRPTGLSDQGEFE